MSKNNISNIDVNFDSISEKLDSVFETAHKYVLSKNNSSSKRELDNIEYHAKISKAVVITAIKAYHEELMKSLHHTND